MTTLPKRLRRMADHTGLDAVAELLREAADTLDRREAVIRILERDALAEQPAEQEPFKPDWDRVEALRESLREHMADVRQLRAALAWIASHKNSDWPERCQQIVDRASAALAEQPEDQMPIAMKTHGAWDGLELLDGLPDGACLYTAPQPATQPGYKLVPVEPTPEMLKAAIMLTFPPCDDGAQPWQAGLRWGLTLEQVLPLWAAILAASPEAPQPAKRVPLTDEQIKYATLEAANHLLDHIYEYGVNSEGVIQRIYKLARAIERAHGIGETND